MSTKRIKSSDVSADDLTPRKRRATYGLNVKIEVINRRKKGERVIDISRELNIPDTTVHTILKKASDLEAKAKTNACNSSVKITRLRSDVMEIMEKRLAMWIEDLYRQRSPTTAAYIQEKALSLYEYIRNEVGEQEAAKAKSFSASKGWFHRFQKRYAFQNLSRFDISDIPTDIYAKELKRIIDEGGFNPKQIFSAHETILFWKRMPPRAGEVDSLDRASEFSEERLTLLLGGNATGDLKFRPLLVFQNEDPLVLEQVVRTSPPLICKSHRKAWMTREIFRSWYVDYFIPTAKKYCEDENIDFKVMLILDKNIAHLIDFVNLCPQAQIVFLPPLTTSIMQPIEQGVTTVLKAFYLSYVLRKIIEECETLDAVSVHKFLKKYTILDCIHIINAAWKDISHGLMNECWRNLCPYMVFTFELVNISQICTDIVKLAEDAGFNGVDEDDVELLLSSRTAPLTNEELAEIDKLTCVEETKEEEMNVIKEKGLCVVGVKNEMEEKIEDIKESQQQKLSSFNHVNTKDSDNEEDIDEDGAMEKGLCVEGLREAFAKSDEVINYFIYNDPVYNRAAKFERGLKDLLSSYKKIFYDKLLNSQSDDDGIDINSQRVSNDEPGPSGMHL